MCRVVLKAAAPQNPRDEVFLAYAIDANSGCIVGGDRRLLELQTYRGIPNLTVKGIAEKLEKQTQ